MSGIRKVAPEGAVQLGEVFIHKNGKRYVAENDNTPAAGGAICCGCAFDKKEGYLDAPNCDPYEAGVSLIFVKVA